MRIQPGSLAALAVALTMQSAVAAVDVVPAAVFLRGHEVCMLEESAPIRCLTSDGAAKSPPKWAPDGQRIAYMQMSGLQGMFAQVVVMNDQGAVQRRMPIGAAGTDNEGYGMMTTVVGLRWFGTRRVVVEGHLNPSDSEYVILDPVSGRTVAEIGDQSEGAGFSADGMHWAVVSGVPHFTRAAATTPTLEIDGRTVLRLKGGAESFGSRPKWSDDASQVAILMQRGQDGPLTGLAVGRAAAGPARVFRLPFADTEVTLHWCGAEPCVMRKPVDPAPRTDLPGIRPLRAQWWRLRRGTWVPMSAPARAAPPAPDARRAELVEQARRLGVVDADFR